MDDRIVLLIDMDCFYVQVEQRDRPETIGKPCVVAQYNGPVGGGYRAAGAEVIQCISELFTGVERASIDEAYIDITDIVNTSLDKYDDLSGLSDGLKEESFLVAEHERLLNTDSISQPWSQTNVESLGVNMKRLVVACLLTYQVRQNILKKTGFKCSAGIAPNKTLAKLACSLNKPNRQTLVAPESAAFLLQSTPISKIRNLGGKLGAAIVERFGIRTLGELSEVDLSRLEKEFGAKIAHWLHALTLGVDSEAVTARSIAQSIGCSKNFFGSSALTSTRQISSWLTALASELVERLTKDCEENQRHAGRLTLFVRTVEGLPTTSASENIRGASGSSFSRVLPSSLVQFINSFVTRPEACSTALPSSTHSCCQKIAKAAIRAMHGVLGNGKSLDETWESGITCLSLSAGKFSCMSSANQGDIRQLLKHQPDAVSTSVNKQADLLSSSECDDSSNPVNEVKSPAEVRVEREENEKRSSFFRRLHALRSSSNRETADGPTISVELQKPEVSLGDKTTSDDDQCSRNSETTAPAHSESDAPKASSEDRSLTTSSAYFTAYTVSDWTVCEECGSRVSIWQLPEHSDFHVAQRIQQEWSASDKPSSPPSATASVKAPSFKPGTSSGTSSGGGAGLQRRTRGRGSEHGASNKRSRLMSRDQKRSTTNTVTLDSFFQKPRPAV